jgi:hypothetical protein
LRRHHTGIHHRQVSTQYDAVQFWYTQLSMFYQLYPLPCPQGNPLPELTALAS